MKKRILGFLLALCLVIGLLPAIALAEEAAATTELKLIMFDKAATSTTTSGATVNIAIPAGSKFYASTDADGALVAGYGVQATEPASWNIMIDNTTNPAVMVLDGAVIDPFVTKDSAYAAYKMGTINITGDGALEIRVKSDSIIYSYGHYGLCTNMGGGTTITCDENNGARALLTVKKTTKSSSRVVRGAIREAVGSLTFKDANLYTANVTSSDNTANKGYVYNVYAKGNLVIDNTTLTMYTEYTTASGIKAAGDLIIKNKSFVDISNDGRNFAVDVTGEFVIDSASLRIWNRSYNSAPYTINKMPTLIGVSGKYYNTDTTKDWEEVLENDGWEALNLTDAELADGQHNYWRFSFEGCPHKNAGKQLDCTTAVVCPDCGATIAAAVEHTVVDDKDCTTAEVCTVCKKVVTEAKDHTGGTATCAAKAVCEVCGKEYGELGHEPEEGTYTCEQAHPCKLCDGNYREAGVHIGGGTAATCEKKAVCSCGAEYGELAACIPAADDNDCSTAVKCTVCGKETTAAQTHKYTDNTDTICDNAGCAHVRVVENGGDNPQTGDNTPVVLFVVLATLAAVAVIFTKKRAII